MHWLSRYPADANTRRQSSRVLYSLMEKMMIAVLFGLLAYSLLVNAPAILVVCLLLCFATK